MFKVIFLILLFWVVIGLVVFVYGIYTAKEIDPKSPFLNGDYDPDKDPNAPQYVQGY